MEEEEEFRRCTYTTLACPHCGDTKQILDVICLVPFYEEFWSDLYRIAPSMPEIFPVQKCNHCGKYYFIKEEQHLVADMHADVDVLNYQELKEAVKELSGSEQSAWETYMLNRSLIQAYNSEFMRGNSDKTPSEEDRQQFLTAVEKVVNLPDDQCLRGFKGELLRETGRFDEAVEVLRNLPDDDAPEYYVRPILERALNRDSRPLLIMKDDAPLYG